MARDGVPAERRAERVQPHVETTAKRTVVTFVPGCTSAKRTPASSAKAGAKGSAATATVRVESPSTSATAAVESPVPEDLLVVPGSRVGASWIVAAFHSEYVE